ncbi:hypothetical protein LR48_Vigan10g145000 [Vigna angularis]|uniref:Uncharacterized protein n=1 Tax=Phaseolus angularis TaxID=3914 RepID=A0A0L9VKQ8_PHAAN|nr:hypothetical protein LR48_Vigan10g145000 [Vigna angularis]
MQKTQLECRKSCVERQEVLSTMLPKIVVDSHFEEPHLPLSGKSVVERHLTKETLSVELVKYCYGDRGIAGSSLVCLRKCSEEEVILREVFGGSVSSFVKIQRRCCLISCGIKRGVF